MLGLDPTLCLTHRIDQCPFLGFKHVFAVQALLIPDKFQVNSGLPDVNI